MSDHLLRLLSTDGLLRASIADTTLTCNEACRRQGSDPTASVALGRLLTGTALLGSQLKGEQRLALQVEGNGPLHKIFAESDAEGHVRASLKNPVAGLPPKDDRFDVAGAVGRAGFLHVYKDLGLGEPYHGMVQLQSSEIGDDIAYYLATSEQIPSSVAVGVRLSGNGSVAAAGGFLIQALPGCPPEPLLALEERIPSLVSVTEQLFASRSLKEIAKEVMGEIDFGIVAETALAFRCNCSRAQILRMLTGLSKEERQDLASREDATSVTCEYCRENYSFTPAELAALQG
ncbi:MAG: Hsp33 family molecular chaperone HslO [Desulfuromonas sp.]|nr:MAG: Hsp33 family molecular chaperone HslO [Desulfuromonas sp.]